MASSYCFECDGSANAGCIGALARVGTLKAHWECWSKCNLKCEFCYRTRSVPLDTATSCKMLEALATGGIQQIAFVGGDPSLRTDLDELCLLAKQLGLRTEVQTNADVMTKSLRRSIPNVDLFGVSLDAASAVDHDKIRKRTGNFYRVLDFLDELDDAGKPYVVRSLASRQNITSLLDLGDLVLARRNAIRWSIVQFSPIGDGHKNSSKFNISDEEFANICDELSTRFRNDSRLNIYPNKSKLRTYMLIRSDGGVYNSWTTNTLENPLVGNMTLDHIVNIADRLKLNSQAHLQRYEGLFSNQLT